MHQSRLTSAVLALALSPLFSLDASAVVQAAPGVRMERPERPPAGPAVYVPPAPAEGDEAGDEGPQPIQSPGYKVEGLELPADREVKPDQGYVFVTAKTTATKVRWLLLGNYPDPSGNRITETRLLVQVPPKDGAVIVVYAVGLVGQALTPFARTTITVRGTLPTPPGPAPAPTPGPAPTPAPASAPRHATVVLDLNAVDNATASVLNSRTLREWLEARKIPFRIYDVTAPEVAQRKLTPHLKQANGKSAPTLIVQTEEWRDASNRAVPAGTPGARKVGVVRYAEIMPATEDAFKKAVDSVLEGK